MSERYVLRAMALKAGLPQQLEDYLPSLYEQVRSQLIVAMYGYSSRE